MSKGPSLPSTPLAPLGGDPASPEDRKRRIRDSTASGGLENLPKEYEHPEGDWKTILSDHPFERLYLDGALKEIITAEMVKRNYEILSDFWKEKLWLLQGQDRDRIARKYGGGSAGSVREYEKILTSTYETLATEESIETTWEDLDRRRLQTGLSSLARFLGVVLSNGSVDPPEIEVLLEHGREQSLGDGEIAQWMIEELLSRGFEPENVLEEGTPEERLRASGTWRKDSPEENNRCPEGHPNRPEARFCSRCGTGLKRAEKPEPPTPTPPVFAPEPPKSPKSEPPDPSTGQNGEVGIPAAGLQTRTDTCKPERPEKSGRWMVVGIVGGVLALAGPVLYMLSGSSYDRRIDSLIDDGQLVYPLGANVLEETMEYLQDHTLDEMDGTRNRIIDAAKETANEIFEEWQDNSDPPDRGWSEVERLANLVLLLNPDDVEAHAHRDYALAQWAFEAGNYAQALHLYRQSLSVNTDNGTANVSRPWDLAYNGVGKACWRLGDTDCAIEAYRRTIEVNPEWVFPYLNLAGLYFQMNQPRSAESFYRKAIEIEPRRSSSHYLLAEFLFNLRQYREARVEYESALRLGSSDPYSPDWSIQHVNRRISWLRSRGY